MRKLIKRHRGSNTDTGSDSRTDFNTGNSQSAADFNTGTAVSVPFQASDSASFSLVSGASPTGTSLSAAGLLTGTASAAGAFTFTIRAFGATAGRVFFAVMMESVVATFVAGLVGVLLAIVLIRNPITESYIALGVQDIPAFPIEAALIGLGAATLVGALAGLLPALAVHG